MKILERYELILEQGLQELGPLQVPENREEALRYQAGLAPLLGDIFYRLSIEHGMPFGPFRETVISILTEQEPEEGESAPPFASALEELHPLIQLALEMMPAEAADL